MNNEHLRFQKREIIAPVEVQFGTARADKILGKSQTRDVPFSCSVPFLCSVGQGNGMLQSVYSTESFEAGSLPCFSFCFAARRALRTTLRTTSPPDFVCIPLRQRRQPQNFMWLGTSGLLNRPRTMGSHSRRRGFCLSTVLVSGHSTIFSELAPPCGDSLSTQSRSGMS